MQERKILFTSDIFRDNEETLLNANLSAYYETFVEQITLSIGQRPFLNPGYDTGIFDTSEFYRLCDIPWTIDGWIKISSRHGITDQARNYFTDKFKDYFVIGFHINPIRAEMLTSAGIPYMDFYEGNIRFLEDIHFAFRSDVPEIYSCRISLAPVSGYCEHALDRGCRGFSPCTAHASGRQEPITLQHGSTRMGRRWLVSNGFPPRNARNFSCRRARIQGQ